MAREEAEIKELSKKLAQQPDSMVFVQLADAYRRAGDLEQSVQVCLKGLERHPTYTTARAVLGRNYLDLGKLDEAASEFRQIEVADPENIMAHRMLGQIFLEKGQYAEAIARQQRVLALDPDDTTAQELLQEALTKAKQHESAPKAAVPASTPAPASPSDQLQTLKVADIYIKKGAFDEAAEVLQEVLAADPTNALAQQKLKEVNQRRGQRPEAGSKSDDDDRAQQKAEAEAKRKAEEETRQKAEAEAKRKAEEEEKQKAEAEAKRKAEEESRQKAEAEAKRKAEEESRQKAEAEAKRKAEEEEKQRADAAEARQRAEAEAEAARLASEAEAKQREAEEQAQRSAAEEAARVAEAEAKERQANKLSSDDILSVMAGGHEELISDEPSGGASKPKESAKEAVPPVATGLSDAVKASLADFIRAQAIEASLLLAPDGKVMDAQGSGDHAALSVSAAAVFHNTEKAARAMNFGGLKQIMIVGEDTRQILFVSLKAGVLVALTGRNTNLGLLRVAVNDLVKRV
jgi:predicted regulator of Ras-like GTPase activity (Roadblock/LC7/MglB family)/cytochrome c-type biogenesis protein CcmH/NrfG